MKATWTTTGLAILFASCTRFGGADGVGPTEADASTEADGARRDGGSLTDSGGSDAWVDPEPSAFCADARASGTGVALCDDFERDNALLKGPWTTVERSNQAPILTISTTAPETGTRSLSVLVPSDGNETFHYLSRSIAASASALELSFSMRLESYPIDPWQVAALSFGDSRRFVLLWRAADAVMGLLEQNSGNFLKIAKPALNAFVRYKIQVTRSPIGPTVQATMTPPGTYITVVPSGGDAPITSVAIGSHLAPPSSSSRTAFIDGVVLR